MAKRAFLFLSLIIFLSLGVGANPANANGCLPATGGVLGPEFTISSSYVVGVDDYFPDIAFNYNHKEYLVVWHQKIQNIRNIYAQRLNAKGAAIGPPIQISNSDSDIQPSVAYDYSNDNYLVVWMKDVSGNGTQYEIWGRIIPWDGYSNSTSFKIFGWPTRTLWSPKTAYNSNYPHSAFFVIWNALDKDTSHPTDISGVHVSPAGVPDQAAHNIAVEGQAVGSFTLLAPHQADLVVNSMNTDYFVVWRGTLNGWAYWKIFGVLLYYDGSLATGIKAVGYSPQDEQNPAVGSGGDSGYLAVWSHQNSGVPWITAAQMYNMSGNWTGSTLQRGDQLGDQTNQAIAGNETGRFLTARQVAFPQGNQIWGMVCKNEPDGTACLPAFPIEETAFWNASNPAVASDLKSTYLVAYEGKSAGDPSDHQHIYGRIFSSYGVCLPVVLR